MLDGTALTWRENLVVVDSAQHSEVQYKTLLSGERLSLTQLRYLAVLSPSTRYAALKSLNTMLHAPKWCYSGPLVAPLELVNC
jgi:hypothetical protein